MAVKKKSTTRKTYKSTKEYKAYRDHLTRKRKKEAEQKLTALQLEAAEEMVVKKSQYYLVTSASEDSVAHSRFLSNLEAYRDFLEKNHGSCEIIIMPVKYSVPDDRKGKGFDPKVLPYLSSSRLKIHKYLQVGGDIPISPTAKYPVRGMESISGQASLILGSPKSQYESLPTLDSTPKKTMTSCSCTMPRYTKTKAGIEAKANHKIGFVIVEIDSNHRVFHQRQITAEKSGDFQDIIYSLTNKKVTRSEGIGAVFGDSHSAIADLKAHEVCCSIVEEIGGSDVFLEDLHDMFNSNHHELSNPARLEVGDGTVAHELEITSDFLNSLLNRLPKCNFHVVRSNHDDAIDRWVINTPLEDISQRKDRVLHNKLMSYILSGGNNCLEHSLKDSVIREIDFMRLEPGYKKLGDAVVDLHGHLGLDGARGSVLSFSKFSSPVTSGHIHKSTRINSAMSTGRLCKDPKYAQGKPSSWTLGSVFTMKNFHRVNIDIHKSKRTGILRYTTLLDK